MKKQCHIRKAIQDDSSCLQSCMKSAYSYYQDRTGGMSLPPMDVDYLCEIKSYHIWVAEFNGDIVGGLIMMFEKNYASIADIAIHPKFQGQGLGGCLLKFAEIQTKEKYYSELRLVTHVLLTKNISLYLHLGWTEIDRDDVHIYFKKKI